MNKIVTHLDLELSSSNQYKIVNAQQLDHNTRQLEINLYDKGKRYDLSNVGEVRLGGIRGDGKPIREDNLQTTGNTIIVDLSYGILCAKGTCHLKILLYNGEDILSSFPFVIKVDENIYDSNGIMEDPRVDVLDEHISNAEKATSDCIYATNELQNQLDSYYDEILSHNGNTTIHITSTDREKIAGIATGAEVNQNAFSNIKVGNTTISSDSKTDTLEIAAGSNITIIPDAENDKITLSSVDTKYTHPATSGNKHIPDGGSSGQILKWSADGTAAWGEHGRHIPNECTITSNWDSVTTNGFYMGSNAANSPVTGWLYGIVVAHNANYVYQEVWQLDATSNSYEAPHYSRIKYSGTWGAWKCLNPESIIKNYAGITVDATTLTISNLKDSDCGLVFSSCSQGIYPVNNAYNSTVLNLGSSTRRFGTIYAMSGTINTSDIKQKKDIESLSNESEKYLNSFDEIEWVKYRWKNNANGGLTQPPSSRYHLGAIAQHLQKTLQDNGISNMDTGIIHANFFMDNTTGRYLIGGNESPKEGYDYSENVYQFKHNLDYEINNEIVRKPLKKFDTGDAYMNRSEIGFIMFEDLSKVSGEGKQPPVTINSITLVDNDDNYIELELSADGLSYYETDDLTYENPLSEATLNKDNSITISFNKMWSSYMIPVTPFDIYDYKEIILDVDFIGQYKCYLIPNDNHTNANVWDRERNGDTLYDYSLNYNELYNLSLFALQETRKEFKNYKENTDNTIRNLVNSVTKMQTELSDLKTEINGG